MSEGEWTEIRKRSGGRENRLDSTFFAPRPDERIAPRTGTPGAGGSNRSNSVVVTRRSPKTAAVITEQMENFSYAAALKNARESISLKDLEIEWTKIRKAANGSLLIEVIGPDGADKAMKLKNKLQGVLQDQARVTKPIVKSELRLVDLHDATSSDEVIRVIAKNGGCIKEDVKVGAIRPLNNGLFTVWVQCPLDAAVKIAKNRRISIGWTQARVDLLSLRPTQCFRCWKFGHLKHACSSTDDFSNLCFRCGGDDHMARS